MPFQFAGESSACTVHCESVDFFNCSCFRPPRFMPGPDLESSSPDASIAPGPVPIGVRIRPEFQIYGFWNSNPSGAGFSLQFLRSPCSDGRLFSTVCSLQHGLFSCCFNFIFAAADRSSHFWRVGWVCGGFFRCFCSVLDRVWYFGHRFWHPHLAAGRRWWSCREIASSLGSSS